MTTVTTGISQKADSFIASSDAALMTYKRVLESHARVFDYDASNRANASRYSKFIDSITYLQSSIECERRWIVSYISHKDISMNLVRVSFLY